MEQLQTDEASSLAAGPPLTSSCAAWVLTSHGPLLVHGPGFGDPWPKVSIIYMN